MTCCREKSKEKELHLLLKWMSCPWLQECERQELHNGYWSMVINSKCSFSAWEEGQGDWMSFYFDSYFQAEMLLCIPASEEGENPSLAPTSWLPSFLCNVCEWGRVRALYDPAPGQLLAEVAELSDRGGQRQDLSLQAQLHLRACLGQLPLNFHHGKPVHHQPGQ